MTTLEFTPQVFTIATNDVTGNVSTWNLLTVDGEAPNETVYFLLKGDAPRDNQSDAIIKAIEYEDWEVTSLEDSDYNVSDFDINIKIFETAPEEYSDIREILKQSI